MPRTQAVFIDTSIFDQQQYNFSSRQLSAFLKAALDRSWLLLLPDPTEREIVRHIGTRSQEALEALRAAQKRAPFLTKWQRFPKEDQDSLAEDVYRVAIQEWGAFLAPLAVLRLGYDGIDVRIIMDRYDNSTPPFKKGKKRKEFPDAFAVAMLEKFASDHGGAHVAVASADADFEAACGCSTALHFFPSIAHLTEALAFDEATKAKFRAILLDNIAVINESIKTAAAGDIEYCHDHDKFDIAAGDVEQVRVTDIRIVDMGLIVGSNDRECMFTFVAEIDAAVTLSWWEYDEHMGEDASHLGSLVATGFADGTATATLDVKENRIKAVTSIHFDNNMVAVTETPRRRW